MKKQPYRSRSRSRSVTKQAKKQPASSSRSRSRSGPRQKKKHHSRSRSRSPKNKSYKKQSRDRSKHSRSRDRSKRSRSRGRSKRSRSRDRDRNRRSRSQDTTFLRMELDLLRKSKDFDREKHKHKCNLMLADFKKEKERASALYAKLHESHKTAVMDLHARIADLQHQADTHKANCDRAREFRDFIIARPDNAHYLNTLHSLQDAGNIAAAEDLQSSAEQGFKDPAWATTNLNPYMASNLPGAHVVPSGMGHDMGVPPPLTSGRVNTWTQTNGSTRSVSTTVGRCGDTLLSAPTTTGPKTPTVTEPPII